MRTSGTRSRQKNQIDLKQGNVLFSALTIVLGIVGIILVLSFGFQELVDVNFWIWFLLIASGVSIGLGFTCTFCAIEEDKGVISRV